MSRRAPRRPASGSGHVRAQARDHETNHVEKVKEESFRVHVEDLPDGDARVMMQHGFKHWSMLEGSGMTVESTCSVEISCEQSEEVLARAAEIASDRAYKFGASYTRKVLKDLDDFQRADTEVERRR